LGDSDNDVSSKKDRNVIDRVDFDSERDDGHDLAATYFVGIKGFH